MGKLFNAVFMNDNFSMRRALVGPSFAEERRGNPKIRKHTEPSGDISSIGRDEGETEQDSSDEGRKHGDGEVGAGLHSSGSRSKTRL